MKVKKSGLLKWMGLLELIVGALNLANGLMSLFVLVKQGGDILAKMQADLGVTFTMQELSTSVLLTVIGGGVMLGAGLIAMMFNGIPDKENLPLGMGVALLIYILVSDIVNVVMLKGTLNMTAIVPFLIHGLYLFGAFRNRQEIQNASV